MSSSAAIHKFVSVEGFNIHSRTNPDGFRFNLVSNIMAWAYANIGVLHSKYKISGTTLFELICIECSYTLVWIFVRGYVVSLSSGGISLVQSWSDLGI
ncbi:hypothetical protein VNO77_44671 [Canavalia gladiata]|uniref:Uncharacterized protein n=1 Tax=Canavalia gladiata TaxID=3824 RepID=A0AAN9JYI3_CANGL